MSDDHPRCSRPGRRLRQDDDPQRHQLHGAGGLDHDGDRAERRRQIDRVQGDFRPAEAARRQGRLRRARRHRPRASANCSTPGICYVPQGRNIFPELSVRHNIELGAVAAGRDITDLPARIEAALDRFPVLRKKADAAGLDAVGRRAEAARDRRAACCSIRKLVLIDEPSIGLSPLMVQQTFNILKELRDRGVSILMIEQNARSALEISDFGIVLELGQTRIFDKAERVLNDPRIGQLFLGGAMEDSAA